METSLKDGDLVLDFFAGSGTTGHAALRLSEEERIDASFILVQLPEPTGRDDYKSISDITKERVRRVIQTHEKQSEGKLDLQQKGQSRRKGGSVLRDSYEERVSVDREGRELRCFWYYSIFSGR